MGSVLRTLRQPYGDSRCGSQMGLHHFNIQFGLADSDDYTLWDQWGRSS